MPIKLLKKAEEAFHEPCKLARSWSVRSKTPSVLYHGVTLILTHQTRNFEMIYLSSLLVLYHGLTELQWQTPAAILIACAARGLDPRIRKHISLHFSLFLGKVGQSWSYLVLDWYILLPFKDSLQHLIYLWKPDSTCFSVRVRATSNIYSSFNIKAQNFPLLNVVLYWFFLLLKFISSLCFQAYCDLRALSAVY